MPSFKDDSILIIAPGSRTTLAQLGLPESFTPARARFKSRMFPGEKQGEWEPHKIRVKAVAKGTENGQNDTAVDGAKEEERDTTTYEEDPFSDEGAVWPIRAGKITNWRCFYALMVHIYHQLNTPFHTAILVIAQPAWTPREHEKITQFFFEQFKTPAFALIDAAQASCYAYGLDTACVIDVGAEKADITSVVEFLADHMGRTTAHPECGGETMTRNLYDLLSPNGFTMDMCEQLKKSNICEILPPDTPLPGSQTIQNGSTDNPAAAASTGALGSGPDQRHTAGATGDAPRGPGEGTEVGGEEEKDLEDNEGVLDVASLVTGGKMNEILEKKEKEKAEKAATKNKKSGDTAPPPKPARLKNAERERNSFVYEDYLSLDSSKNTNKEGDGSSESKAAPNEAAQGVNGTTSEPQSAIETSGSGGQNSSGPPRREITVGTERFKAAGDSLLTNLSSAIYRTILSHPQSNKRSDLWNNLVIVGNGSATRGFKEALLATINSRYLISPSSATMFTSELPSNFSTPIATGANTPVHPNPHSHPHGPGGHGAGVNPLLLAATHAAPQMSSSGHLQPPSSVNQTPQGQREVQRDMHRDVHSAHGQTPTSIKVAKLPEYFQEWKEIGSEEAAFLGAQVAAKVIFVTDQDQRNKGFLTRSEYNDQGPPGIHEYTM